MKYIENEYISIQNINIIKIYNFYKEIKIMENVIDRETYRSKRLNSFKIVLESFILNARGRLEYAGPHGTIVVE